MIAVPVRTAEPNVSDPDRAMNEDFPKNLRLLCSYYRSIAEVCRRLDVNRAQFNKYLSGTTRPSRFILLKMCDFFGVEVHEIFMPHARFSLIIRVRSAPAINQPLNRPYLGEVDQLQAQTRGLLDKYLGYYFEYHYSMTFPEHIIRSLSCITTDGNGYYFQRFERMRFPDREGEYRSRYKGVAFMLSERIFLIGYESMTRNEIAQTILYPTYKSRVSYLSGLKLGVSARDQRDPVCARVVLESLGQHISIRNALKLCGLFGPDSDAIDSEIRDKITTSAADGFRSFFAIPL